MIWFVAFSIILIALSKTQSIETILLLSMAIISSVRIASYYSQALAREIAKILPFALLAVLLMEDIKSFLSLDRALSLIEKIPTMIDILIYYFVFAIFLEFILRIIYSIAKALSERDKNI
jgi:hypothetical protein